MEVILLEKLGRSGNLGDVVSVKPGYARNYLLPKKLATLATPQHRAAFESRRAELEAKSQQFLADAKARAEKIQRLTVVIEALASEEGKLYGSVGTVEIAKAVTKAGEELKKREVLLPMGSIHEVGMHTVELQLHTDVIIPIQIEIVPSK